jgi:Holliday junction DNA helicase RuvA
MIRLVRGVVVARSRDALIVDIGGGAGGIGFKVMTPEPTAARFHDGATVLLHTYLQVREDALTLFGFESEDELQLFEMLITVSGVGPKMALSLLSTLSPDAFRLALANQEPALLARTPAWASAPPKRSCWNSRTRSGRRRRVSKRWQTSPQWTAR